MSDVKTCAYCGAPAGGNHSIHRDGFGDGPEVWLCDAHGGGDLPACEQIWTKLNGRQLDVSCYVRDR